MRKQWMGLVLMIGLAGCGGGGGVITDTAAPQISQVELGWRSQTLYVSAVVQDAETGVASVVARVVAGNQTQTVVLQLQSASRYECALPSNTARVTLIARDHAGNERTTDELIAPPPNPPF